MWYSIELSLSLENFMSILNYFWQCSSVGADVLISSGGGGGSVQFHSSNLKKLTTLLDFFQNSQVISTTLCTYKDTKKKKVNIRGELKKSGLASEAITRVLRQLEQNGQVLRNPYNICKILVYSSFGYVEN